jgi:hypothetical protein
VLVTRPSARTVGLVGLTACDGMVTTSACNVPRLPWRRLDGAAQGFVCTSNWTPARLAAHVGNEHPSSPTASIGVLRRPEAPADAPTVVMRAKGPVHENVAGGGAELFNNATQVVLMRNGTRMVLSMQDRRATLCGCTTSATFGPEPWRPARLRDEECRAPGHPGRCDTDSSTATDGQGNPHAAHHGLELGQRHRDEPSTTESPASSSEPTVGTR